MIDIVSANTGTDIGLFDTQTTRATNILSVQEGRLAYAADLGIDLRYFLDEEFRFQNESFRSYLVQKLAERSINVASVTEQVQNLFTQYNFNLVPAEAGGGLVTR